MVTEFTPFTSLLGGGLIGIAAAILMWANGRIAGISGIASKLLPPYDDGETLPRLAFIAGLVIAPILVMMGGGTFIQTVSPNSLLLIVAGLLVGFGSVYGSGCTSGHGVCGLSRVSRRSLAATATFMIAAALTVFAVRHVFGAP